MRINGSFVKNRVRKRQRGLAAVEFVIVLPLIVLIAYAMVELGRGLYHYNTLNKAVHDGARFLADDVYIANPGGDLPVIIANNPDNLVDKTKRLVVSGDVDGGTAVLDGLTPGDVTVTSKRVNLSDGGAAHNHIVVSATYTFPIRLFPDSIFGFSLTPTITATAVERALKI